ncbi:MAG: biopolymer transporter ExbD [Magnetococcales bacterium]|nr:biopolymer transporter ExbD [Magnetococcales bacterium]
MRFRNNKKPPLMMDVTPLVDVVFLLLIFFMVTTTFSNDQGIKLDLPKADTAEKTGSNLQDNSIRAVVDSQGRYYIDNSEVMAEQLSSALLSAAKGKKDVLIHVQADKNSSHGSIVYLMDTARKLNLNRFSLVTLDQFSSESEK